MEPITEHVLGQAGSSLPDCARKAVNRGARAAIVLPKERRQKKDKSYMMNVEDKDVAVGGGIRNRQQIPQERTKNGIRSKLKPKDVSPSNVNGLSAQCKDERSHARHESRGLIGGAMAETTPKKFKPRYSKLTTFDEYIHTWREHVREAQLEKSAVPPESPEVIRQRKLEEEQYQKNIEQFMKKCYQRSVDDPNKTVWVGGRVVFFEQEARKHAEKESEKDPVELALGERLQLFDRDEGETANATFSQSTYLRKTSEEHVELKQWELKEQTSSTSQNAYKYDPGYVSHGQLIFEQNNVLPALPFSEIPRNF